MLTLISSTHKIVCIFVCLYVVFYLSRYNVFSLLICIFRVVGVFRMVLQKLINENHLDITDSLLDNNNTVLKVRLFLKQWSE